jgi:hypothetical protein
MQALGGMASTAGFRVQYNVWLEPSNSYFGDVKWQQ